MLNIVGSTASRIFNADCCVAAAVLAVAFEIRKAKAVLFGHLGHHIKLFLGYKKTFQLERRRWAFTSGSIIPELQKEFRVKDPWQKKAFLTIVRKKADKQWSYMSISMFEQERKGITPSRTLTFCHFPAKLCPHFHPAAQPEREER